MRILMFLLDAAAIGLLVFAELARAQETAPAPIPISSWQVSENVEALTGAKTITATLLADAPIANMLGQPDHPALILRCQENVLAAYVAWPQVLSFNGSTFGGRPQTMVLWRLDDQPIAVNFWLRSNDGAATGMFETKPAAKLLEKLIVAKRLAIRLTGNSTQDAAFSLSDIQTVAARVGSPCGVKWTMKP